ncbi:MAG TPA: DUF885 family protein, partial [Phycisphaerales bacterium]|nr:DUF885 family protein [Phycisphaerales bacterium]
MKRSFHLIIGFAMTAAPLAHTAHAQTASEALHDLMDERIEWMKQEFPEYAMSRGDYRNADHITDSSMAANDRRAIATRSLLSRLHLIETGKLGAEDMLDYQLFDQSLSDSVEGEKFHTNLMPIDGRGGPQQDIPQMAERVRFQNADDYDNYLKRLDMVPQRIDDTIAALRKGLEEKRTPPKIILEGLPEQFNAIVKGDGLDELSKPFDHVPATVGSKRADELKQQFETRSLPAVREAMKRLADYVDNDYIPKCRQSIAATDLPDGKAYYEYQLRTMTTTNLTPQQIFDLGQSEVKRIRAEMMQCIRSTDFPQVGADGRALYANDDLLFHAFLDYLRTNPRFYCKTPEELVMRY